VCNGSGVTEGWLRYTPQPVAVVVQRLMRSIVIAGAQSLALGHAHQNRRNSADAILLENRCSKPETVFGGFKIGNFEPEIVHLTGQAHDTRAPHSPQRAGLFQMAGLSRRGRVTPACRRRRATHGRWLL
jgi:hypothetical protein